MQTSLGKADVALPSSDLLDLIYPVGSIYMSVNATSDWEGLFNGRGKFTTTGNMSVSGSTSWAGGDNSTSDRPTTLSIDVSHKHSISHTHTTETKGKDSAHNNMPPYLAVYCWKRVS